MNPENYKFIPLDEIAKDSVLRASYIGMIERLHTEYFHNRRYKKPVYVHQSVMPMYFDDVRRIGKDFNNYLDFIHGRGKWSDFFVQKCISITALVDVEKGIVVGEAGFYIMEDDSARVCNGYDVIDPMFRGQGLGNLILPLRFDYAKQELGSSEMVLQVDEVNDLSNRRVTRLQNFGFVNKVQHDSNRERSTFHVLLGDSFNFAKCLSCMIGGGGEAKATIPSLDFC